MVTCAMEACHTMKILQGALSSSDASLRKWQINMKSLTVTCWGNNSSINNNNSSNRPRLPLQTIAAASTNYFPLTSSGLPSDISAAVNSSGVLHKGASLCLKGELIQDCWITAKISNNNNSKHKIHIPSEVISTFSTLVTMKPKTLSEVMRSKKCSIITSKFLQCKCIYKTR